MRHCSTPAASLLRVKNMGKDMDDPHNSIFFAAVTATRMPMVVTDPNQPDNPIVFANPAFLKLTGYNAEEILGRNCRLLQGPDTDSEAVEKIREALSDNQEISVEILNYKKDRTPFWSALYISPVYDQDETLKYHFASQLDVTRRRETEEALRQSQKMEAVGQLTGGIAHDFNNLLTVIQGYTEILQANLHNDAQNVHRIKRAVDNILQAASRGSKLTSQLLAFSRKQKLEGKVVCIKDLIYDVVPMIERSIGEGIEIDISHHGPLCNARIDPTQAESAIINVAVNARDAMGGRGRLSIATSSINIQSDDTLYGRVDHGLYTRLAISDNGSGMDTETLKKITEPFFTTKQEGKGTGLGMSMVYGFIKQSGGILHVESEVDVGTTVHMLFKCEPGEAERIAAKEQAHPAGRQGDKETILVVEDKRDVQELAYEILTDFGYTVLLADNADSALKILERNGRVDLLFSDIIMPGTMNGVQLACTVSETKPTTKILLTTGYTDTSIDIKDVTGTPFDLIRKPYKRVDLVNKIRSAIDQSGIPN